MLILNVERSRAFSLIELLVVIAIIAVLAALLMTALHGAKLKAQQAQCTSNVKQMSASVFMYVNDNNDKHVAYSDAAFPGGGNWAGTLMDYYARQAKVLICPALSTGSCAPTVEVEPWANVPP